MLLGAASPAWAGDITRVLAATLPAAELTVLAGCGHEAVDSAPDLVAGQLQRFFADREPGPVS
jgi:pimeloyl-ACP methyl ester carboxylesterase